MLSMLPKIDMGLIGLEGDYVHKTITHTALVSGSEVV